MSERTKRVTKTRRNDREKNTENYQSFSRADWWRAYWWLKTLISVRMPEKAAKVGSYPNLRYPAKKKVGWKM
jgi:hypothetical protein